MGDGRVVPSRRPRPIPTLPNNRGRRLDRPGRQLRSAREPKTTVGDGWRSRHATQLKLIMDMTPHCDKRLSRADATATVNGRRVDATKRIAWLLVTALINLGKRHRTDSAHGLGARTR
ncbi:hypothetical protein Acsp01_74530 [Actinoplanes sp. NBRC 101535]|nr:hypothetical protein Acsp01_74530 [Actinoplanes sp. NBRC 101535]